MNCRTRYVGKGEVDCLGVGRNGGWHIFWVHYNPCTSPKLGKETTCEKSYSGAKGFTVEWWQAPLQVVM